MIENDTVKISVHFYSNLFILEWETEIYGKTRMEVEKYKVVMENNYQLMI